MPTQRPRRARRVMRREWKQATLVGLVAFAAPFLGCAAVARFLVGWGSDASWLAGIALSTTSVAVVYAVMLEFGLNRTEYGKIVLAASFVNDLATVPALGVKFSPFNLRTLAFACPGWSRVFSGATVAGPPSLKRSSC